MQATPWAERASRGQSLAATARRNRTARERAFLWLTLLQAPLCFYLKGFERENLWAQRRLAPMAIPLALALASYLGALLRDAVDGGAALLAICGGFQLLARYYRPFQGSDVPGIGLFDAWTEAGRRRMIGNTVVQVTYEPLMVHVGQQATLVGFENHSGRTFLGTQCQPLGVTTIGYGNNGDDKLQGGVYKNAIGCYLHGSLLPKNPHLADYLITVALRRRHGDVRLSPLDDSQEWTAHVAATERARQTGNPGLVRRT